MGPLFYVLDDSGDVPLFCGSFAHERVALRVNHDGVFARSPVPPLLAADSAKQRLVLDCVATSNPDLIFLLVLLRRNDGDRRSTRPRRSFSLEEHTRRCARNCGSAL